MWLWLVIRSQFLLIDERAVLVPSNSVVLDLDIPPGLKLGPFPAAPVQAKRLRSDCGDRNRPEVVREVCDTARPVV